MIIVLLAVPLTLLQIAAADTVPNWDVTRSCKGAADAGFMQQGNERLKSCLDSEQRARQQLQSQWTSFPGPDRAKCVQSIQWFEPTYTELASCLEMSRDVRNGGAGPPPQMNKPQ